MAWLSKDGYAQCPRRVAAQHAQAEQDHAWRERLEPLLWGLFSVLGAGYVEREPDLFTQDAGEILAMIRAALVDEVPA